MHNPLLTLLLIISFPAFSTIYAYKGNVAGKPIKLYMETNLNQVVKGFWVVQNDVKQRQRDISTDYELINSCFEINQQSSLTLYANEDIHFDNNAGIKKIKDSGQYFKFNNLHLEQTDDQQSLPKTLKGYWFNGKHNQQKSVELQKLFAISEEQDAEFDQIELLQSTALDKVYFTAVLSKQKNDKIKLVGINLYDKDQHKLLQQIPKLNYSYNHFNCIILEDINFDNKLNLVIKKYLTNSRLAGNYDYYLNNNGKFVASKLWSSDIYFNLKDKSAIGSKNCYNYDEQQKKIITKIDSFYQYKQYKNQHYIHKTNSCQIHYFNTQASRQYTEDKHNACLLKRNNINFENPHYIGEDNILHKNIAWDKCKLVDGVVND